MRMKELPQDQRKSPRRRWGQVTKENSRFSWYLVLVPFKQRNHQVGTRKITDIFKNCIVSLTCLVNPRKTLQTGLESQKMLNP